MKIKKVTWEETANGFVGTVGRHNVITIQTLFDKYQVTVKNIKGKDITSRPRTEPEWEIKRYASKRYQDFIEAFLFTHLDAIHKRLIQNKKSQARTRGVFNLVKWNLNSGVVNVRGLLPEDRKIIKIYKSQAINKMYAKTWKSVSKRLARGIGV